jgi:hypothetical protein
VFSGHSRGLAARKITFRHFLNPWIARVGTVAKILEARLDRYACAAPAVPT